MKLIRCFYNSYQGLMDIKAKTAKRVQFLLMLCIHDPQEWRSPFHSVHFDVSVYRSVSGVWFQEYVTYHL